MLGVSALVSSVALVLSGAAGVKVEQTSQKPVLTLSVTGRGWGHGIGMSQWGAYGFAVRGSTYREILAHYYRGTELGNAGVSRMRVLIVESAKAVSIGSASAFRVTDGSGETRELEAGTYELGRGLKIGDEELVPPLRLAARGSPLAVNGVRYRGTVAVTVEKGRLNALNTVGLEAYLLGVVPSEVPRTWPIEALKAQAVAARSYALATRKPGGPFDAYADVRSQVYRGLDGEAAETNAAVRATAGQVLLWGGKVATTYFFSTSGGRTVDVSEAWPGSAPVPYLVSVEDPYDDASPYHRWGPVTVTSRQIRSALKLRSLPVDARVRVGPSGRVTHLVLTLEGGGELTVPATTVRSALALRSTWFRIGVLFLQPPARRPVAYGTRARVSGVARGAGRVTLERRPAGGVWQRARLSPAKDGTFTFRFRGERTTEFRLTTPRARGAILRVPVAPRLQLRTGASPGRLEGTVMPAFPGAAVAVQRREGTRWVAAGETTVGEDGAFQVVVDVVPGTYRARLGGQPGYAVALSRALSVSW